MSTKQPPLTSRKLFSQLLQDDADLRDIVEEFVNGLDNRLGDLRQAHERLDWEQLTMLAHRLKGASGSYGYPDIGELAATMEREFRAHQADDFATWVEQLGEFVAAARNGLADT